MSRRTGNGPTPVRPAPAQRPPTTPVPAAPPLHVLVAEDNEFSARLMEQLLARRGHRVRLATSGPEALALAEGAPSTCCSWTSTCRGWTASASSGRSGSENGPREGTCLSSP